MSRKTAVITGGNAGLGLAVAEKLLRWDINIHICLACRNKHRAEVARDKLLQHFRGASVDILIIDVSSLRSVYRAAQEIKDRFPHIDYLYLNAGIMPISTVDWTHFWTTLFTSRCIHMFHTGDGLLKQIDGNTEDGLKQIFATNLFGHFVLIKQLEDKLSEPDHTTQIIWTSSSNAKKEAFSLDDMQHINGHEPYSSSKYACDMLSVALNERMNKVGLYSHTTCPGMVMTNLTYGIMPAWVWTLLFPIVWLLRLFVPKMTYSVENGAAALHWVIMKKPEELDPMSKYHSEVSILGKTSTGHSKLDIDPDEARKLYHKLEKMEHELRSKCQ